MTNPIPKPSPVVVKLAAVWGLDPITLARRARSAGLNLPEDLAGVPAIYRDGRPHQGTIREACEAAGVDINGYYQLKRRKPHLSKDEILDHLTLEGV